jgi:membrane-associated protease RseP (regulator of RpoE activity)
MNRWKVILPAAALLLFAGQAVAQSEEDEERLRETEARELEIEERLRDAEARMAEAAREIAEITKERLPRIAEIEKRFAWSSKPRLGVTIESAMEPGPVEGVTILGVSPGSAAEDSGLRPGDILTAVNDEGLSADSCEESNMRLLDFMNGVEEGDVLKVEYLRDGKVGSVQVEPRIMSKSFAWAGEAPMHIEIPPLPMAPEVAERFNMKFGVAWAGSGLGDLELVQLNEGLGSYFGTDKGLLVVKAPKSDAYELRDGDVIQSIDGREPKDVRHAMRILSSYQAGEKLQLGIMRDKKKVTIDVEIPADQHGSLAPQLDGEFGELVRPVLAPAPSVAPLPEEAVIVIDIRS